METALPAYQLSLRRPSRLVMFGLLYFAQGATLAYFRNFQKPYLDEFNIKADTIGLLTTLLLLPFIFKIFIGMLSDRVNLFNAGNRKPYIIDGLVTFFMSDRFAAPDPLIGAYLALVAVSLGRVLVGLATGIPMLLALGIGWGIAWGFQETILVALIIRLCDSRIAASMFAIMVAVSNIGTAIGDGGAIALSDNWGYSTVFITLALLNVINIPILWGLFRVAPELTASPQPVGY
jgi:hypothetical protein